ncbi:hypothetical protein NH8B_0509 [Pseudogulbenkiania sp. NH8B]|uniref:hypothetical protein n=1 Tax=Pseudogulbenkiania sp. (strain NH8B) TaxID=748280 RepID=UPI0002279470|nr:hypothetical protein [Pseudogulbenkiania sp. NH8B]BAK75344.1 hypothetical protein NH8B_0509 [Pseudogulbenkiania sp. NH8B]
MNTPHRSNTTARALFMVRTFDEGHVDQFVKLAENPEWREAAELLFSLIEAEAKRRGLEVAA